MNSTIVVELIPEDLKTKDGTTKFAPKDAPFLGVYFQLIGALHVGDLLQNLLIFMKLQIKKKSKLKLFLFLLIKVKPISINILELCHG